MNEEELIKHCQREVEIAERIRRYDKHYLEHKLMLDKIKENKELNKYKSLYENEKSHTDTLKRIIKKIEEILQKEYKENIFGHYEYDLATAKNTIKKILNLLKEIK